MERSLMKLLTLVIGVVLTAAAFSAVHADAGTDTHVEKTIVISLHTDEIFIEDMDLSHLAVGDAETIVTDSGKTVDMLRTEDGIEIYVDGERLDMGVSDEEHHEVHKVTIICDDDGSDCEELAWNSEDVEVLSNGPVEAHGTVHIVRELDESESGELHEEHEREVIIIKKHIEDEI
jgi:hypothetical protein